MKQTSDQRLISMTYWYPILKSIGIRVPDTTFVHYPHGREIFHLLDGKTPKDYKYFVDAIDAAVATVGGYPVFIRTEQSSDKHSWENSCYLPNKKHIGINVGCLMEHSAMADWPCDFFVVRRLIPTKKICTAFYGNMPIAKERRMFVKDGEVICNHPYWPKRAFDGQKHITEQQIKELQQLDDADDKELTLMATYISRHIPGAWSVDFLQDIDGKWWCIDMALANASFHWPSCPNRSIEITKNLITGEERANVPEGEDSDTVTTS